VTLNRHSSRFDRQLRYRIAMLQKTLYMKFDCFLHYALELFQRLCCSDAAGQFANIGRPVARSLFTDQGVLAFFRLHDSSSSASRRIDLSVFGFTSSEGSPATVTSPFLTGCRNCRGLPRVRSRYHRSSINALSTSRVLMVEDKPKRRRASLFNSDSPMNRRTPNMMREPRMIVEETN